jgi:hypothetical protein
VGVVVCGLDEIIFNRGEESERNEEALKGRGLNNTLWSRFALSDPTIILNLKTLFLTSGLSCETVVFFSGINQSVLSTDVM